MTKLKEPTTIGELQPPTLDFTLDDLGVFFNVSNNETFPIALTQLRDLLQEDFKLDIPDIIDLPEDLQDLLDSITNITEGDITFQGDNIFSGDNITFQNDVTIEGNIHLQDLTNMLINGVSLETILGDYVLDADLTTTLDDYVTNTDLSSQLSDYALLTHLNDYTLTVDSLNIASWIDVDNTDLTLTKATHHNKLIALNFTNGSYEISLQGGGTDWSDFQCKFVFLGNEPHKVTFDFIINESNEIELFNKYGGLDLYYKDSGWVAFFTGAASGNVKDDTPPTVTHFTLNHNTHNNNDTINFASFSIDFDLQDDLGGDIDIVLTILEDDESTPVAGIDSVDAVYNTNNNVLTLTNDNNTFDLSTGTYYMQAVITDHAGNEVTQTADTQITILDATAPHVTDFKITDPELGSRDDIDFHDFAINVVVSDETSNTIDITFTIYDDDDVATAHSVNATYDGTLTIDPHSKFNLDADGYYIKATFSDEAGNSVEVNSNSFSISNGDVFVEGVISKGGDIDEWEVVLDSRIEYPNTIVELEVSGILLSSIIDNAEAKSEYRDSMYLLWKEGMNKNVYNGDYHYGGTSFSPAVSRFYQSGADTIYLHNGSNKNDAIRVKPNETVGPKITSQSDRVIPAIRFNSNIGYIPLTMIPYLSQDPGSLNFNDSVWPVPALGAAGTTVLEAKQALDSQFAPIGTDDTPANYDILYKLLKPITGGDGASLEAFDNQHVDPADVSELKEYNPYILTINMQNIEDNLNVSGGRQSKIDFALVTGDAAGTYSLTPYRMQDLPVGEGFRSFDDTVYIYGLFDLTFTIHP